MSVVPAIAGANGCCCPDLGVIALTGPDLRTWRHELGHLLDPALEDRSTVQGEAFADLMATLLADTSPATATEAAALVAHADRMVGRKTPTPGLPTDPLPMVMAFQGIATAAVATAAA